MTAEVELLLIRGLPGSGKTTMAKKYAQAGYVHCEADQYFEADGEYRFDGSKLRSAHDDCLRRAIAAMDAGRPVVVANTFTRRWEMEPYLKAAKKRGINARIVEATGNWANVHGVPADAIERMRARWEPVDSALATQQQEPPMTAETDLLPLPHDLAHLTSVEEDRVEAYVRANVEHATAPLQAEVEALRAEVETLRDGLDYLRQMQGVPDVLELRAKAARAERLAEELREIANQGPHYGPDGTYKTWRHWAEIARAALDQEKNQ